MNNLSLTLSGDGFLILCRALQEKFFGVEDAILTQTAGHDRLRFVAQKVGLYAAVDHLHAGPVRVNRGCMQDSRQAALRFDLIVVARDMRDCKCERERF
jgi:hypothetical protein